MIKIKRIKLWGQNSPYWTHQNSEIKWEMKYKECDTPLEFYTTSNSAVDKKGKAIYNSLSMRTEKEIELIQEFVGTVGIISISGIKFFVNSVPIDNTAGIVFPQFQGREILSTDFINWIEKMVEGEVIYLFLSKEEILKHRPYVFLENKKKGVKK